MSTLLTILLAIIGGLIFGYFLVKFFIMVSNMLLERKAKKEALKKDSAFFFKDKPYNLKEQVEHDLKNYTPWYKKLFNREKKGVSDYGRTTNAGVIPKQVSTSGEGNTSPATATTEQPSINTTETRREQRVINRSLFEERTKNHRLLL
jgi:hypothetical protein